jgi:hypothetical protein
MLGLFRLRAIDIDRVRVSIMQRYIYTYIYIYISEMNANSSYLQRTGGARSNRFIENDRRLVRCSQEELMIRQTGHAGRNDNRILLLRGENCRVRANGAIPRANLLDKYFVRGVTLIGKRANNP